MVVKYLSDTLRDLRARCDLLYAFTVTAVEALYSILANVHKKKHGRLAIKIYDYN